MICPVCLKNMGALELDGVEVDFCFYCKGLWFDDGELEILLGNRNKVNEVLTLLGNNTLSKEKQKKCPVCSRKMIKTTWGESSFILLDKCQYNHGLWFDGGELEKVLNAGDEWTNLPVMFFISNVLGNKKREES